MVTKAVCDAVTKCGTFAICRYPVETKLKYRQPAAAVYIKESRGLSSGFGEYIGTRTTPEGGETEIYGKKLEMTIGFDVFLAAQEFVDSLAERAGAFSMYNTDGT